MRARTWGSEAGGCALKQARKSVELGREDVTYTLGITSGSESGVALFEGTKLVFAVSEERLSREKLDDRYPERSLEWVLAEAGIRPKDVARVCYGFTNGIEQGTFFARLIGRIGAYVDQPGAFRIISERLRTETEIDTRKRAEFVEKTSARFPGVPVHFCHHHESHQASAFMASPFERALVVTLDGRGDYKSVTISEAGPAGIEERTCAYSWESLGYFYGRMTHLCGFKPNRHEGKITGLAAHGDPRVARSLVERMIELRDGRVFAHLGDQYVPFFSNYSEALRQEASKYSREDLAAAAQWHLEDIVTRLVKPHVEATGLRRLCLAGGVFANVKLSQRLREMDGVEDVFIYPGMSDGGVCAGAVYHHFMTAKVPVERPLPPLYLGPDLDVEALRRLLEEQGVSVTHPADLVRDMCEVMTRGQVVGLVDGRMEFGPRALGHRSILASPADPDQCDKINARLRRTEFMPFAPSIAAPLASRCLQGYRADQFSARHMTISYGVTEEFRKNSPAVVHVDGTARPQVVFEEDNPFYFKLLDRWYQKHGGLCMLNTSFNIHEEPIICSAEDVARTCAQGTVDYLAFPPYLAKFPEPKP